MKQIVEIFLITIAAELVAIAVLTLLGGFFSKKLRWLLTVVFGRVLDIDVEYVFRNKREADEDIRKEMGHASFVHLLTGRGSELQRDTFIEMLGDQRQFRILLPVTNAPPNGTDWTAAREAEIATIDKAFGSGILKDQIDTTARYLEPSIARETVELKRFNYPHVGRILITDRVAYFTPYRKDRHGRDSMVIKYRRGGEMYDFLARLFDQLWMDS